MVPPFGRLRRAARVAEAAQEKELGRRGGVRAAVECVGLRGRRDALVAERSDEPEQRSELGGGSSRVSVVRPAAERVVVLEARAPLEVDQQAPMRAAST